jgi:hypothetical protein
VHLQIRKRPTSGCDSDGLKSRPIGVVSAAQIASILYHRHGIAVAERTVRGQLRRAGLHREALAAEPKAYGRYEAGRPNERWITDVLVGPWVPWPRQDGSVRARLFLIVDDHSRLLVDGRFYGRENARACQELLRRAITRRGVPQVFYVEYVPRNIFSVLFPAALCAWRRGDAGGPSPAASWQAHNSHSELSQFRSVSSDRQIGVARDARPVDGGSQARTAASLVLVLISAYRFVVDRSTWPSQPRMTLTSTPASKLVDGSGVPEGVRGDLAAGAGIVEAAGLPAHDLVDARAGQRLPVRGEDR